MSDTLRNDELTAEARARTLLILAMEHKDRCDDEACPVVMMTLLDPFLEACELAARPVEKREIRVFL